MNTFNANKKTFYLGRSRVALAMSKTLDWVKLMENMANACPYIGHSESNLKWMRSM